MKRILLVAVAVAFAATAWAGETVKAKVETKAGETKATITEKAPGVKEVIKIDEKSTTVTGTDVTKWKQGDVAKDTVQFQKYEANGDYFYVLKDTKVIRLKHKLSDSMKKDFLAKVKPGDTFVIQSTRPLTDADLALMTGFEPGRNAVTAPTNR